MGGAFRALRLFRWSRADRSAAAVVAPQVTGCHDTMAARGVLAGARGFAGLPWYGCESTARTRRYASRCSSLQAGPPPVVQPGRSRPCGRMRGRAPAHCPALSCRLCVRSRCARVTAVPAGTAPERPTATSSPSATTSARPVPSQVSRSPTGRPIRTVGTSGGSWTVDPSAGMPRRVHSPYGGHRQQRTRPRSWSTSCNTSSTGTSHALNL